jgi:hypothetical protein
MKGGYVVLHKNKDNRIPLKFLLPVARCPLPVARASVMGAELGVHKVFDMGAELGAAIAEKLFYADPGSTARLGAGVTAAFNFSNVLIELAVPCVFFVWVLLMLATRRRIRVWILVPLIVVFAYIIPAYLVASDSAKVMKIGVATGGGDGNL